MFWRSSEFARGKFSKIQLNQLLKSRYKTSKQKNLSSPKMQTKGKTIVGIRSLSAKIGL